MPTPPFDSEDVEPSGPDAGAHDRYEDALSRLDAARLEGDRRQIARLERELEQAKRDWRRVSRKVRRHEGRRRGES